MSEAGVTQSIRYTAEAEPCVADTGALLRRACTAHVLERPASASRRAADVTDHDRICGYHWQGVQQHSALVEVCLSQTSAPRLVQSYSNRIASWRRRAQVSSRTRRRVNVGLVSVGEARKKHFTHTLETCLSRLRSDDIVTPRTFCSINEPKQWRFATCLKACNLWYCNSFSQFFIFNKRGLLSPTVSLSMYATALQTTSVCCTNLNEQHMQRFATETSY